jgi:hypothetical protein
VFPSLGKNGSEFSNAWNFLIRVFQRLETFVSKPTSRRFSISLVDHRTDSHTALFQADADGFDRIPAQRMSAVNPATLLFFSGRIMPRFNQF